MPEPDLLEPPAASVPAATRIESIFDSRVAEQDPYRSVSLVEDKVVVTLRSGATAEARFSIPMPGVLRVRVGEKLSDPRPSSMVLDLPDGRPSIEVIDGGLKVTGPGVDALWTPNGLQMGAYKHGPDEAMFAGTRGGRITFKDGRAGWAESFWLAPEAEVFGTGEAFLGPRLRGKKRRMVNSETHGASGIDLAYINVPFFWSDAGWGLFVHTAAPMTADFGATVSESGFAEVEGDELDFFVFNGDAPTIIRNYLRVTGLPGRFPDWALGVWLSRCSFLNAKEVEAVLDELAAAGCPVDVVHVDHWLEGSLITELACSWSIDRNRWPEGWARRLGERGLKVSLWHNPYVDSTGELAKELEEEGFLVRDAAGNLGTTNDMTNRYVIDITHPEAVAWWKEQITRTIESEGNSAFKPDFAEEIPETGLFHDGRTGRELRNEYSNLYQRATHEAMSTLFGDDGVALFCRSGTAGAQRYPCHWVGDTPATWPGIATALRACLSLAMSGFGFVAHDIGGFWCASTAAGLSKAVADLDSDWFTADVEPELYARWTQWGALSPVMRFHGTGRREPTAYPEPARSVAIEACRLRERLRPYLEEISKEASTAGLPMMRPMPLAFPGDRTARDADLQYMLGSDVLVAPILERGGNRTLFVPEGRWIPLVGMEPVLGPAWVTVECDLAQFPAYAKESSAAASLSK